MRGNQKNNRSLGGTYFIPERRCVGRISWHEFLSGERHDSIRYEAKNGQLKSNFEAISMSPSLFDFRDSWGVVVERVDDDEKDVKEDEFWRSEHDEGK